jgi:hypothetical protein
VNWEEHFREKSRRRLRHSQLRQLEFAVLWCLSTLALVTLLLWALT